MESTGKVFRDAVLALLAVVAFCCVIELGLRAAGVRFEAPFYAPDREFGWVSRPNLRGWNVWENENWVQMNSIGMHDREHSLHRDPNVIRIAVLGDSATEAKEVPLNQNYCAVLERDLNNRLAGRGLHAEVLNFAVGGYDLAQDYLLLEQRVWQFDPQIVIVANMTGIMVRRSTRKLYVGPIEYGTPFFVLRDGQLTLDDQTLRERASFRTESGIREAMAQWINGVRLLGLLHAAGDELKNKVGGIKAGLSTQKESDNPDKSFDAFPELGVYAKVLRVEQEVEEPDAALKDADVAEAWRVTEAMMQKIRDTATLHHAQSWFFTLDLAFQVEPDRDTRKALFRRFGVHSAFGSDKRLADFATRAGISCGVLGPDLLAYAERYHAALHGFPGMPENSGHLNAIGHSLVGHLMAQKLWEGSPLMHRRDTAMAYARHGAVATP